MQAVQAAAELEVVMLSLGKGVDQRERNPLPFAPFLSQLESKRKFVPAAFEKAKTVSLWHLRVQGESAGLCRSLSQQEAGGYYPNTSCDNPACNLLKTQASNVTVGFSVNVIPPILYSIVAN